jgi:penicillin amidase
MRLPGLESPVEVIRDRWGIPHIFAKNTHDLFFAQGFVAAQDRLWQLDLWRRLAEGTLAELVGPDAVNRDVFARLLRYRGDMEAEWKAYRPDARAIVDAFVAGVNAQIALVGRQPEKLPIEFQLTRSHPEPWTPEVVIGRMAGYVMTRNARTELQRAKLVRAVGADRASALAALDPVTRLSVPDGLDLEDISDDVLALAEGVSESVRFPEEIGSNDWVVAGRLTATGKPILANDPRTAPAIAALHGPPQRAGLERDWRRRAGAARHRRRAQRSRGLRLHHRRHRSTGSLRRAARSGRPLALSLPRRMGSASRRA